MRLVTFVFDDIPSEYSGWGVLQADGDILIPATMQSLSPSNSVEESRSLEFSGWPSLPGSLLDLIASGPDFQSRVEEVIRKGGGTTISQRNITLTAPLRRLPSLRDFYAFEQHVSTAHANRGREVPAEWYEMPVFYFSNPASVYGPDDNISRPSYTQALDYELEVAAVIGDEGYCIRPEDAMEYIAGFMIFNDWSARDIQRKEMKVGLGPAKGKDFASSFGPWLVTPDELIEHETGRPGVYDLQMTARVNGMERSRGNWADIHFDFGQLLAHASQDVWLYPGDVIGSGTVGTGCLLELTKGEGPWLQPDDEVELEIEKLGILRNTIT